LGGEAKVKKRMKKNEKKKSTIKTGEWAALSSALIALPVYL